MNYDKKLAKYAKQLRNPKYYDKISDIIDKAFKENYEFKQFSLHDLEYLTGEIEAYYEAITTDEEHERMVKFCNSYWIVVSDKNYVMGYTEHLLVAIHFIIKTYITLFFAKIKQALDTTIVINFEHVNKDLYLCHGGLKAAEFLGCDFLDLSEKMVELN